MISTFIIKNVSTTFSLFRSVFHDINASFKRFTHHFELSVSFSPTFKDRQLEAVCDAAAEPLAYKGSQGAGLRAV